MAEATEPLYHIPWHKPENPEQHEENIRYIERAVQTVADNAAQGWQRYDSSVNGNNPVSQGGVISAANERTFYFSSPFSFSGTPSSFLEVYTNVTNFSPGTPGQNITIDYSPLFTFIGFNSWQTGAFGPAICSDIVSIRTWVGIGSGTTVLFFNVQNGAVDGTMVSSGTVYTMTNTGALNLHIVGFVQ